MNRYPSSPSLLNLGAFALPLLPILLALQHYDSTAHPIGYTDLAILWTLGLALGYLLILIHEGGHWLAGRCVGIEIDAITIGHWRQIVSFRVGQLLITLRAAPDSGSATLRLGPHLASRTRMSVFLLGGVAAEFLVLILAWHHVSLPAIAQTREQFFVSFFTIATVWLCGLHLVFSLYPHQTRIEGGWVGNDGAQLFTLWRTRARDSDIADKLGESLTLAALQGAGRFAEARVCAEELFRKDPSNTALGQSLAHLQAELGDTQQAEMTLRGLLATTQNPEKRAEILDALACLALYHDRRDLLSESVGWMDEALRCAPAAITLRGTLGSILIELGRLDEGVEALRAVHRRSECALDRSISAAYLAKDCRLRGEWPAARRWLSQIATDQAEHRLIKRIRDEFPPAD